MNDQQFREAASKTVEYVIKYTNTGRERDVLPNVEPGYLKHLLPADPPVNGEPFDTIIKDVDDFITPGITHWQSPNFHAYFPTGESYPSILADMFSAMYGVIGFTWISSPACTELETVTLDWLGKMLGLPDHFLFNSNKNGSEGGSVLQATASESTHMAILAAKTKKVATLLAKPETKLTAAEIRDRLVLYTNEQAHSSVERGALLASVRCHLISPDPETLGLRGSTLKKAMQQDKALGFIPMAVIATLGTTNTCAFDHLSEIGPICEAEDIWLHVDAAYAGSSFICPEFRKPLEGIQHVSSFNMSPHKWLLVNFDCSAMFFRNREDVENAFKVNPVYLQHKHQNSALPDYRHWHVPLGRRFRSLKLWFVIRTYGVSGLQDYIRRCVKLTKEFEEKLRADDRFEIFFPVTLGLACFRYKGSNAENHLLLEHIHAARKIHITPTRINDQLVLRFSVGSQYANSQDIIFAWNEITRALDKMLDQINTNGVDEEQQADETSLKDQMERLKIVNNHCDGQPFIRRIPLVGDRDDPTKSITPLEPTILEKSLVHLKRFAAKF